MKIRTVGESNIFINKLTKYGRKRNEIIQSMKDNGCQIIKEYRENCNSRVYLGYLNQYVSLANYAARIQRDGSYEKKYSKGMYSPLPSSAKTFYVEKIKHDKNGNIDIESRLIKIKNGKTICSF